MGESGVDSLLFLLQVQILRDCYLQYTSFLSLSELFSRIPVVAKRLNYSRDFAQVLTEHLR